MKRSSIHLNGINSNFHILNDFANGGFIWYEYYNELIHCKVYCEQNTGYVETFNLVYKGV